MKPSRALLCWAVLSASLIACKSNAPGSAEDDSKADPKSTAPAEATAKPDATPVELPDIPAPSDVGAVPKDAERSDTGLAWKVLQAGEGDQRPDRYAIVTLNYTGWTPDGRMFDTSQKPGSKRRDRLEEFVPGWLEGVQLMLPGEKRRFWLPGELAYGEANSDDQHIRPDQPRGRVVYDIELIGFEPGPRPPREVPEDVAEIPKNARKSKSGLAWRVLEEGTGKQHPTGESTVSVNYIGWTTDGKMASTSFLAGGPATLPLVDAFPGWQEGIQMMVVGETRRFWIPEDLAYAGRPGYPKGMLVYDVQLVHIKN